MISIFRCFLPVL